MKARTIPKRAFELTIKVSADDWDGATCELRRVVSHVEDHGPACESVGGGVDHGHIVTVEKNPEMTNERYFQEIETWRKEQRK